MAKTRILCEILGGNLLPQSGDDRGTYDETASVRRYAEQCQEALAAAFPGASIEVDLHENTSGGDGDHILVVAAGGHYRPGDPGEYGRMADQAQEIVGQVWEAWSWVVYDE